MDDIIAKINDIIVQINEEEKLDIDFPESYIEDLSKAYITRDLSDDELKCSWSIQTDSAKSVSNIRSIVWPGYYAYHKSNCDLFGGVYIGFGIKNVDIPFMQQ